jgi:hypothetical protein
VPALRRAAGVVTALLLLWVLGAPGAFADTVAFTWSDARVTAPVGLATDHDHSLYWTANSTADKKVTSVYAVGDDGRVRATMKYGQSTTGVLAVGYDASNLYALDKSTKTNTLRLAYMTLSSLVVDGSLAFHFYELVLPDAGQTIVALIVEPNNQFYVVAQSGRVYKGPAKPSLAGTNRLTKVSDGTGAVTGGYYDATQNAVVLRTAANIVLADPTSFATTRTIPAPAQEGARGIAGALDGASYLLTGLGNGNSVLSVGGSSSTPSATPSATTTPSASPSVSASPTATSTTVESTGSFPMSKLFGNGTRFALGGALLVALVAGVVAFVRR